MKTGYAVTTQDLVECAMRLDHPGAAGFLRNKCEEDLPIDLALDALRVQLEIEGIQMFREIQQAWNEARLGILLPVPPHVADLVAGHRDLIVLIAEGDSAPPHVRRLQGVRRDGIRSCRQAIPTLDVLVFEAHVRGEEFLAAPHVADVLDGLLLERVPRLIVHPRPHPRPDDVLLAELTGRPDLLFL